MPDLMIVDMQQCESSWGTKWFEIGGYTQTIVYSERNPFHHCSCDGFKFGQKKDRFYGKTCKHLEEAHGKVCTYHEQFDGPPKKKGICPRCGGPTTRVRVGV